MMKLMIAQEQLRTRKNKTNTFSKGGKMGRIYAGEEDDPYFDRIGSGLKLEQVKGEKRQLFERIEAYYQHYC